MSIPFDNSYVRLSDAFFTPIEPTPVRAPVMIRLNHDPATERGLAAQRGLDVARIPRKIAPSWRATRRPTAASFSP